MAGVLVLEPPLSGDASGPAAYERIRRLIAERLPMVPRLRQRAVRVPLDLQLPLWVDDPAFDLDAHVRRAALPAPGGPVELDALLGEAMGRPLPADRPLWEMVIVEGLADGRSAVVARLHHALLDGVSGATAMAAFLDLAPPEGDQELDGPAVASQREPEPGSRTEEPRGDAGGRRRLPSGASLLRYAATSLARQPDVALEAFHRGLDAMIAVAEQNRRLAADGRLPPPSPFRAPRTSLNGNVTAERVAATFCVPLDMLERVRVAAGGGVTVNDVILAAVGTATTRLLSDRGEHYGAPLVALVPVSTRGPATVPEDGKPARAGNAISGMLVPLPLDAGDHFDQLRALADATRIAKEQEERAGGDLLEGLTRAVPPAVLRAAFQGVSRYRLFDRLPPPFNLVVSTIVLPDVDLWWADRAVSAVYPLGPVVDGVGLNVTALTYQGKVSVGVLACPRQVPEVGALASLIELALADLAAAA